MYRIDRQYSFINPDPTLKSNLMAFGFECDDGWIPLLRELFDNIEQILADEPGLVFQVLQVKEKFGTLRVYYYGGNEEIEKLTDNACDKSEITCETCGEAGELRDKNYWYRTLCDLHYEMWLDNKF